MTMTRSEIFRILILITAGLVFCISIALAGIPKQDAGGVYEITTDGIGLSGSPYTAGGDYELVHSAAQSCGVSTRTAGTVVSDTGYIAQLDYVPPAVIGDFLAETSAYPGEINLTWTSTGDDLNVDTIYSGVVGIKYSKDPGFVWGGPHDFDIVQSVTVSPGDPQNLLLDELDQGDTYYFRVWLSDELSNWSGISNAAEAFAQWSLLSVSFNPDSYNFGELNAGVERESDSYPIVVTNEGNVHQTYSLGLTEPSRWTHSTENPGSNVYVLDASFSDLISGVTWSHPNHALSTVPRKCVNNTVFGNSVAGESGFNVPPQGIGDTTRNLWYRLFTPLSSSVTTEQSIGVTITAEQE